MIPRAILVLLNPISYSAQMAKQKNANSMIRRTIPEVTIGAPPERLGSSGTANVPHIAAAIIGIPKTRTNRIHPSVCFQPQIPIVVNADSSRRNRMARLIGCDPIYLSCLNYTPGYAKIRSLIGLCFLFY